MSEPTPEQTCHKCGSPALPRRNVCPECDFGTVIRCSCGHPIRLIPLFPGYAYFDVSYPRMASGKIVDCPTCNKPINPQLVIAQDF